MSTALSHHIVAFLAALGLTTAAISSAFGESQRPHSAGVAIDAEEWQAWARDFERGIADATRKMAINRGENRVQLAQMLTDLHHDIDIADIQPEISIGSHFVGAMDHPREIVKNAPYSAEAITESVRVLGDGNRIVRKTSVALARDGVGRTRQEKKGQQGATVWIYDPIEHLSVVLNPNQKSARRISGMHSMPVPPEPPTPPVPPTPPLPADSMKSGTTTTRTLLASHSLRDVEVSPGKGIVRKRAEGDGDDVHVEVIRIGRDDGSGLVPPMPPMSFPTLPRRKGESKALGARDFDGVKADGTQTSYTIHAGEIGNEKPIVVASERWFSPELYIVVYAKTSDPRVGETTYRLANLKRAEPAPELFKIPADYKMRGEGRK